MLEHLRVVSAPPTTHLELAKASRRRRRHTPFTVYSNTPLNLSLASDVNAWVNWAHSIYLLPLTPYRLS